MKANNCNKLFLFFWKFPLCNPQSKKWYKQSRYIHHAIFRECQNISSFCTLLEVKKEGKLAMQTYTVQPKTIFIRCEFRCFVFPNLDNLWAIAKSSCCGSAVIWFSAYHCAAVPSRIFDLLILEKKTHHHFIYVRTEDHFVSRSNCLIKRNANKDMNAIQIEKKKISFSDRQIYVFHFRYWYRYRSIPIRYRKILLNLLKTFLFLNIDINVLNYTFMWYFCTSTAHVNTLLLYKDGQTCKPNFNLLSQCNW